MSMHKLLPVRLLAAHLVLLGATVAIASAQDAGPPANQSDADANPIDTSITTQPPAHSTRGAKAHGVKKTAIAHASGNSGNHHRNLLHGGQGSVVRNSIGQPVKPMIAEIKATPTPRASELANGNSAGKNPGSLSRGGTETAVTVPHGQGFVPLQTGAGAAKEPRINTAMNHAIISGRDMIRPGSGAGTIGGPAKNASGTISGTRSRLGSP